MRFPRRRQSEIELQAEADREAAYQRQFAGPAAGFDEEPDQDSPEPAEDPAFNDCEGDTA